MTHPRMFKEIPMVSVVNVQYDMAIPIGTPNHGHMLRSMDVQQYLCYCGCVCKNQHGPATVMALDHP